MPRPSHRTGRAASSAGMLPCGLSGDRSNLARKPGVPGWQLDVLVPSGLGTHAVSHHMHRTFSPRFHSPRAAPGGSSPVPGAAGGSRWDSPRPTAAPAWGSRTRGCSTRPRRTVAPGTVLDEEPRRVACSLLRSGLRCWGQSRQETPPDVVFRFPPRAQPARRNPEGRSKVTAEALRSRQRARRRPRLRQEVFNLFETI